VAAALLALLPLQMLRIAWATRRTRASWQDCAAWGFHCAFGKIPQAIGVLRFHHARMRGRAVRLIEHRAPSADASRRGRS
jgi:hypothetical protein